MSVPLFLGLGFMISIVVSGLMVLAGVGDAPDHRSSHASVTPTGGGVGVIAALGMASFLFANVSGSFPLSAKYAQILSLVFAIGFLGLMDDILDLAAIFKLFFMLVVSFAAVYVLGPLSHLPYGGRLVELPLWLGWALPVLWIFGVMNVVNFMDGINGLMLVVMGVAGFFLALIGITLEVVEPFVMMVTLTSAIMGLAFYNFRTKAAIFSGDVGSLTIGFVFAVCVLWISDGSPKGDPIYVGPILILPFLIDAFMTILARVRRGEKLMQAHRTHLYQRMASSGFGHMMVTLIYGFTTLLLGLYAFEMVDRGLYHLLNFPLFPAALLGGLYLLVSRRFN